MPARQRAIDARLEPGRQRARPLQRPARARSRTKIGSYVCSSPSVGTTAVISVTWRRTPPAPRGASSRSTCTTTSSACENTRRTIRSVTFSPAISAAFTERVQRVGPAVGVDGAQEPAAGVDRTRELERLGAAHLADDDPIGPHGEHELHEVAERDLAGAVETGRPHLVVRAVRRSAPRARGSPRSSARSGSPGPAASSAAASVVLPAPGSPEIDDRGCAAAPAPRGTRRPAPTARRARRARRA